MKKLICVLISLMMLLGASACAEPAPAEKLFTPGTYSAEAQGIFVPVKVQVTVTENEITSVLIDATGETPELGGMAAGTLAESIRRSLRLRPTRFSRPAPILPPWTRSGRIPAQAPEKRKKRSLIPRL